MILISISKDKTKAKKKNSTMFKQKKNHIKNDRQLNHTFSGSSLFSYWRQH